MKKSIQKIIILALILGPLASFAAVVPTSNVLTAPASDFTDHGAVLHGGAIIGNGTVYFGYFRYSKVIIPPIFCNDIFGSNMIGTKEVKKNNPFQLLNQSFSWNTAVDLTPNTTYSYCAIVSNSAWKPTEIKYGGVQTFTTPPCQTCDQTIVRTDEATVMGETSAILNGFYNSTKAIKTYFEYKKQDSADWIKKNEISRNGGTSGALNFLLSGLSAGTIYQFRAVAKNTSTSAITDGDTKEFTTNGSSFISTATFPGGVPFGNDGWTTCQDQNATNFGGILPCIYPPVGSACPDGWTGTYPICTGPGPTGVCPNGWTGTYPNCVGPTGNSNSCPSGWTGTYPNCIAPSNSSIVGSSGVGGNPYSGNGTIGGGIFGPSNGSGGSSSGLGSGSGPGTVAPPPTIGSIAAPFSDAIVHYHEGIETVFTRQIMDYPGLAKLYGFQEGGDLLHFAQNLSHTFAQIFGYVSSSGREIRVGPPDIAAYELGLKDGMLAVYEYFANHLTGIATVTTLFKNAFGYEYYFH